MYEPLTVQTLIDRLSSNERGLAIQAFKKNGTDSWTYSRLADAVHSMSTSLVHLGAKKGGHFVLFSALTPQWIVACLAALRAGLVVVPLDTQMDSESVANILHGLDVQFICTDRTPPGNRPSSRLIYLDSEAESGKNASEAIAWQAIVSHDESLQNIALPAVQETDIAVLFHTSGTSGAPKGVPLTHANILFQIRSLVDLRVAYKSDNVVLPLPLHHVYPFVIGMLYPLALGATIIIPEALGGPQLVRAIQEGNATAIIAVPRLYSALVSAIEKRLSGSRLNTPIYRALLSLSIWTCRTTGRHIGKLLFWPLHRQLGPKLRILACGGAALEPELAWKLEGLGFSVAIGYGLTETSPLLTLRLPGRGRLDSVGVVLPEVEVRIEKSERSADNACGEIQARGPGVFPGYRNLPEKTADAFTGDGWFRTGDLGCFKNGDLHVKGRISSLIVSQCGEKIDPEQLEDHYLINPTIKEIGILQVDGKLVAVVVPNMSRVHEGGGNLARLVHDAVDERAAPIASYKRLSGIVISGTPLSRTAIGKIQRHKLREHYLALVAGHEERTTAIGEQQLNDEDRRLLQHPAAESVWQYLNSRYAGEQRALTLDSSLQLDLGIDSLEWVTLTLEMPHLIGKSIEESAMTRITSVRDLLHEVSDGSAAGRSLYSDAWESPESALSDDCRRWLTPLNKRETALQFIVYTLMKILVYLLFRPKVVGASQIPKDLPVVFIPNHASYIDAVVLAATLPYSRLRNVHWAGFTGISFKTAARRAFCRVVRAIPIDPDRAALSSLALGSAVLQRNESLVWFPEGRRTLTGELQPFRGGIGLLLEHYPNALIVPVYLKDTGRALAPGRWLIHPITLQVRFGAPQLVSTLETRGIGTLPRDKIVSALHDEVLHLEMQCMNNAANAQETAKAVQTIR